AVKLRRLAARKLNNDGLFGLQKRLSHLMEKGRQLVQDLGQAEAGVSWWDQLNVLWESPEEVLARELRAQVESVQGQLYELSEVVRRLVFESLSAYPPLAIHLRALEATAMLARLQPGSEDSLGPDGMRTSLAVTRNRNLALAALGRLRAAFRQAFPEVPLPRELLLERPPADTPLSRCLHQLESGNALELRERALDHALMLGALEDRLGAARKKVSPVDQLAFWSTSAAEAEVVDLQRRLSWHQGAFQHKSRGLLEAARHAGQQLLGLRLRDWTLATVQAVASIHTDGGSSSTPRACHVYNKDDALNCFETLKSVFGQYGLSEPYPRFLHRVATARPETFELVPDPLGGYPPLSPDRLAGLLAARLEGTDFAASRKLLETLIEKERRLAAETTEASAFISVWDTLNIFTVTPAEKRRNELQAERRRLSPEIARVQQHVDQLFAQAASVYPPAGLFFCIDQVAWAIRDITATCHRTSSKSSSGRTYSRYYCSLSGKARAQDVLRRWAAAMVSAFGVMPTYAGILEAWELERLER
ncbi:MAG: hypothetical protein AB1758_35380, partial [Candidatus Eremiobacterota bacterium]